MQPIFVPSGNVMLWIALIGSIELFLKVVLLTRNLLWNLLSWLSCAHAKFAKVKNANAMIATMLSVFFAVA